MAKTIGVPLETILHRARWTNATTFGQFYDKNIDSEHVFQDAVLTAAL